MISSDAGGISRDISKANAPFRSAKASSQHGDIHKASDREDSAPSRGRALQHCMARSPSQRVLKALAPPPPPPLLFCIQLSIAYSLFCATVFAFLVQTLIHFTLIDVCAEGVE